MPAKVIYYITTSFALGIAWQSIFKQGVIFMAFLFVLIFASILILIKQNNLSKTIILVFLIFALGVSRMYITQQQDIKHMQSMVDEVGKSITLKGIIVTEPDKREYTTNLTVFIPDRNALVLVKTDIYKDYSYGDTVLVRGVLDRVKNFTNDIGKEFNYVGYLAKDDIYYIIKRAKVKQLKMSKNLSLNNVLLSLKKRYLENINTVINEPESALAGGITVGSKNSMGAELLEQFRKTGVIHIVVLSGFNVAIVAIFFTYIFGLFGIKLGRFLAIIGIVLFAILTGAGATVVRASAMGILAILALTVRRKYTVLRALFIVGFFMLLYNTKILLSDISFQLSFMATLGMILGMPILHRWLYFIPNILKLREIISATIATQLFVAPLLLYYIGELSLISILANVLVLPLVTISMLFVFLTGAFGFINELLSLPFAYISYGLLHTIISIVQTLASLPYIMVGVSNFNIWFVFIAYVLLALFILRFKSPRDDAPIYIV